MKLDDGSTTEATLDRFIEFLIQKKTLDPTEVMDCVDAILMDLEDFGKWPLESSDSDVVEKWEEFHESEYFPEEMARGDA